MADLALLTARAGDHALTQVLPALDLLPHRVRVLPADPAALLREPDPDLALVDATTDLAGARSTVRTLAAMELSCPVLGVFAEGGLAVVDAQWPLQDLVLARAGPAEVEARIRLAIARGPGGGDGEGTRERDRGPLRVADVVVDEDSWIVRAGGEPLDLTFKEFELLRYLLLHAGRVVTREQLLQEVWGVDYYGGTRTVDVHVRRLRAKLGSERESLISTIRHVGYRFAAHPGGADDDVVQ